MFYCCRVDVAEVKVGQLYRFGPRYYVIVETKPHIRFRYLDEDFVRPLDGGSAYIELILRDTLISDNPTLLEKIIYSIPI